ncbi:MAG: methyltransferase domain-containing protein [bacterium]
MNALYLIVPDTRTGHGSGHIVRAARLAADLGPQARLITDYPWESRCHPEAKVRDMVARYGTVSMCSWSEIDSRGGSDPLRTVTSDRHADTAEGDEESPPATLVIIDAQYLSRGHHRVLRAIAPTIGIDLGGEARPFCSYLIDTLPNLEPHPPNVFDPGLNYLPDRVPPGRPAAGGHRILVTAGGEDAAGLGGKCIRALEQSGAAGAGMVALARGALSGEADLSGFRCLGSVFRTANLADLLAGYDVVITTFGLTAYEALAAGCTVLTVAPTKYHARLSRAAGLPLIGTVGTVSATRLRRTLSRLSEIKEAQDALRPTTRNRLAGLLRTLSPDGAGRSPVSGGFDTPAIHRSSTRTYRASETPAIDYLERFVNGSTSYDESYFFEDYERQYGRSYLEDFEHIALMCRRRLERIERLQPTVQTARALSPPLLIDLGCAYGPMLSAASERGYLVKGTDWFEGAVQYVRNVLGLQALRGDVCDPRLPESLGVTESADVVCMWYVIEHLRDLRPLFANIRSMLKPGGVFAFSTPNGSGGSARYDRRAFLDSSPEDHWTIWNARRTRRFLRNHGFRRIRIHVTGHHPERFAPRLCRTSAGYRAALLWSRIAGLGDTFEAYAVYRGTRRGIG